MPAGLRDKLQIGAGTAAAFILWHMIRTEREEAPARLVGVLIAEFIHPQSGGLPGIALQESEGSG